MSQESFPEPLPRLGGLHSVTSLWRYKPEFYRLVGSQCGKCGTRYFPRRQICPRCQEASMEEVKLARRGRIVSVQMGRGTLMGFEDYQPAFYCIVQLEDGAYVQGELLGIPLSYSKKELLEPSGLMMKRLQGRKVRVVIRRLRRLDNGYPAYGYKFLLEEAMWNDEEGGRP